MVPAEFHRLGLYFSFCLYLKNTFEKAGKRTRILHRFYFITAILVGWVFFYHSSLTDAFRFLGIMFGVGVSSWSSPEVGIFVNNYILFIIVGLIGCTPIMRIISKG